MSVRLFIGNLPYAASEAELRAHLSSVGEPTQIVLPVDRETGRPRGFAFVDYADRAVAEAARVMAPGGRLLIADFAPHKEEFLRDEFAHRRLGFSDREVEGWFTAAGLSNAGSETIAPQGEGEKLTVKLWLATAKARTKKEAA